MMYYVQEYQQARVDLESFAAAHPKHGRVGDAVMEIISAAQLTAIHSDEVLQALYFAAQLAPKAEVHNQFGATFSSTVGLYAAGLATQILRPQQRYREAFAFYLRHVDGLPRDSMIYWMAWRELSQLRVEHLKATGEVLEMPPRPRLTWVRKQLERTGRRKEIMDEEIRDLERQGTHQHYPTIVFGIYATLTVDDPVWQELVAMTPAQPTVELDFSHDPLVPVRWYQQSHQLPTAAPQLIGGKPIFGTITRSPARAYQHRPRNPLSARSKQAVHRASRRRRDDAVFRIGLLRFDQTNHRDAVWNARAKLSTIVERILSGKPRARRRPPRQPCCRGK